MKNTRFFLSEIFPFLVVKFSIYLNRRVFVINLQKKTTTWMGLKQVKDY